MVATSGHDFLNANFYIDRTSVLRGYWVETDRKIVLRAFELTESTLRDPFTRIGKPELLKYVFAGCWLRRLTQEHRLVYRVSERRIDFLQARYHD